MLRRLQLRTAPWRRSAPWRSILVAPAIGALLLAAACESDPNATAPTTSTGSGAAAGSGEPTTSTAAPTSADGPVATTAVPTDGGDPDEPTAPTSTPDPGQVVTGGTTVSHPGGGSPGSRAIRSVDFDDLTYPTSVCADIIDQPPRGGFQLHDGEVHVADGEANGPYSVALQRTRSFGDVNQDGHDDAALILECSRGGQPVPMGWIYTLDDSGPRPLAGVTLDRDTLPITGVLDTSLTSVRISGASVVTGWDVYLDGDALCCPTQTAVVTWTWTDGGLTPAAPTLTRADAGS